MMVLTTPTGHGYGLCRARSPIIASSRRPRSANLKGVRLIPERVVVKLTGIEDSFGAFHSKTGKLQAVAQVASRAVVVVV